MIGGEEGGGEGGGGEGGGGEGGDDGGGGGDGGGDGGSDGGGGEGGGCDGGGDGDGGEEGGGDDGAPPLQCKPSSLFPSPRRSVAVCWLVRVSTTSTRPGSPSPLPPRAPRHATPRRIPTAASVHLRRKPIPEAPDAAASGPRLGRAAEATESADRRQHCPPTIVRAARALRVACNQPATSSHLPQRSPAEPRPACLASRGTALTVRGAHRTLLVEG